ncbi:MAG: hypothetical protein RIG62_14320 [Cyclobacteriaceae bacterium]
MVTGHARGSGNGQTVRTPYIRLRGSPQTLPTGHPRRAREPSVPTYRTPPSGSGASGTYLPGTSVGRGSLRYPPAGHLRWARESAVRINRPIPHREKTEG